MLPPYYGILNFNGGFHHFELNEKSVVYSESMHFINSHIEPFGSRITSVLILRDLAFN